MEQKIALRLSEETLRFENAWRYGKYFYIITLADGRDVGVSADKVLVTDTGALLALSSTICVDNKDGSFDRIEGEQKTILCLANGQWLSFYASSVITGDPVGIEWIEGYKS